MLTPSPSEVNQNTLHSTDLKMNHSIVNDSGDSGGLEMGKGPKTIPKTTELLPEEGFRGWFCVFGAFICLFCSFGFLNAIGIFQTTYQETFLSDHTPSDIAWIFAVQLALLWAPGPLFGRLVDTYGPAPVLYPGAFLCIFSLCMTSLATEFHQIFLAQGLAFGLGAGAVFAASTVCVGQWFVRRRGLAIGIVTTGSSLGGVIYPVFLNKVIQDVGFASALRYTALLMGILLAASCFMIQARLPREKWDSNTKWFDLTLFRDKHFALYTVGTWLVMWSLWAPFDFISSFALNEGFTPDLALYLISIINATSIPGRLLPPYLGDRIGHFNVITVCALLTGGSMLILWLPFNYHHSHAVTIVFAMVYGLVSGAFISLMMPCVFKLGSLETLSQRFGTFQIVIAGSMLTGLPIMGAILNHQNNIDFSGLQLFASVSALVGAGLLAASTYFLSKTRNTWKI